MSNHKAIAVGHRYQQAIEDMRRLVLGWCAHAGLPGWRMEPQISVDRHALALTMVAPTGRDRITVSMAGGQAMALYRYGDGRPTVEVRATDAAEAIRQVVAAATAAPRGAP